MTRTALDLFPVTTLINSLGSLEIAGHSLADLAGKWGTPLYLYDAETIASQISLIKTLLDQNYPGNVEVTYAAKAYFSRAMAVHLEKMDLGVDVVSIGELEVARLAGFAAEKVHLHGNNKSQAELNAAIDWGVQAIVVDSLEELAFLEQLCARVKENGPNLAARYAWPDGRHACLPPDSPSGQQIWSAGIRRPGCRRHPTGKS